MDTSTLKTFVTIADLGSFSQAGEQLYLTQPAISKRISGLEQELNTRLFDRIGRKTTLTEAGRVLYQRANSILAELDDSRREIANLSQHIRGKLIIGTSHHIGLHRLPPVLKKYVAKYPDVKLDIQFMDSEDACNGVRQGSLELAIVTLPLQPDDDLVTRLVWQDPLCVVIGRSHPLAKQLTRDKQKTVGIQQLVEHSAILPRENTFTRQLINDLLSQTHIELNVSMSTNYLETIKMLTSVGLGWSILPRSMINKELLELKVRGFNLQRQLGTVWHRARTLSNATKAMLALLD